MHIIFADHICQPNIDLQQLYVQNTLKSLNIRMMPLITVHTFCASNGVVQETLVSLGHCAF